MLRRAAISSSRVFAVPRRWATQVAEGEDGSKPYTQFLYKEYIDNEWDQQQRADLVEIVDFWREHVGKKPKRYPDWAKADAIERAELASKTQ